MAGLEQNIKDFVKAQGVEVVGIAGPERMVNAPPSLDPDYIMKGARSIVSMALPMDVEAIDDFLNKKSPTPHNLDQLRGNQLMHRICRDTADYIMELGFRARQVEPNNMYRRSTYVLSTHPNFSHRFGALAAGIGAQGWSGNIMTEKYGAAIYLGTVVTDAELKSDPPMDPRHFIDDFCAHCKLCEQACVTGMFDHDEEEQVLINDQLHPRGKRRNIDFCNSSCFGLHSISRDKKWTTWGRHWIDEWTKKLPEPNEKLKIKRAFLDKGGKTGDSFSRYDLIRRIGSILQPKEYLDELPDAKDLPEDELERNKILEGHARKVGITGLKDYNVLTCGQCALVCGPTLKETAERYNNLIESGLVVPGPEGRMINVDTYEEAVKMMKEHPPEITREETIKDRKASFLLWNKMYFGIEPKSIIKNFIYQRKLKKARGEASHG